MRSRWSQVLFGLGAFVLLRAESCWDPLLARRDCGKIEVTLDLSTGRAPIMDCTGSEALYTVLGQERFEAVGLPGDVLALDMRPTGFGTGSFTLTAVGSPTHGQVARFTLKFTPRGRGRIAESFRQEVEIEVTFFDPNYVPPPPPPPPPDPCPPVASADAAARFQSAIAAWALRCNPELSAEHAEVLGATGASRAALGDPSYDPVAAGACLCDLEDLGCEVSDPFVAVASCAAVVTGALADGESCTNDQTCASGYCRSGTSYCGGTCATPALLGASCQDAQGTLRCEAGATCFGGVCTAKIPVDQTCRSPAQCEGNDTYLVAMTTCTSESTGYCRRYRRAGEACSNPAAPCQKDVAACVGGVCVKKPMVGEACQIGDYTEPSHAFWVSLIGSARSVCALATGGNPYCTQTGVSTGPGICRPLPKVGEACGLGANLSPLCNGGICDALDPNALAGASGTCVPGVDLGEACDPAWNLVGGTPCRAGLTCSTAFRTCVITGGATACP